MPVRHTFPKSHRLRRREDFNAVYDAKVRDSRGPLTIYARPNGLPHLRMGISTSRKVGIAARRNRIRRLLRESFRHLQHELPGGYDLLVIARAHEPLGLGEYQEIMTASLAKLHQRWKDRQLREGVLLPLPPGEGGGEGKSE
jgi:ribonuclease P protein component